MFHSLNSSFLSSLSLCPLGLSPPCPFASAFSLLTVHHISISTPLQRWVLSVLPVLVFLPCSTSAHFSARVAKATSSRGLRGESPPFFSSFSSFCVKEEIEKDLGHHNSGIMQINPPCDNGLERPLSQLTEGV